MIYIILSGRVTTWCTGCLCVLTNEDWAEEEGDGDVYNRSRHVQKPVGSHWEESQEEQKEEQTVLVLLHLGEREMLDIRRDVLSLVSDNVIKKEIQRQMRATTITTCCVAHQRESSFDLLIAGEESDPFLVNNTVKPREGDKVYTTYLKGFSLKSIARISLGCVLFTRVLPSSVAWRLYRGRGSRCSVFRRPGTKGSTWWSPQWWAHRRAAVLHTVQI